VFNLAIKTKSDVEPIFPRHARRAGADSVKRWIFLSALGIASALGGCAVGPDYRTPLLSLPGGFLAQSSQKTSHSANPPSVDLAQWWRSLHDRELDSLVTRALEANLDLDIALNRLQAARAQIVVLANQALPEGGATAGGGVGTGTDETKGRATQQLGSAESSSNLAKIAAAGGFDADWELDIFGKIRREVEAQAYDVEALKSARDWVFATVAADVARAYFDVLGAEAQLAVLRRDIAAAQGSLNLAQTRFARGLNNEMDVMLARRELDTLQAGVEPLGAQIEGGRSAIAVLLGQFPESLARELANPGAIPALPAKIPVGTPAALLRRRPDIQEAERRVAAATARIGVATADLFPTVFLTGAAGAQGGVRSSSGTPLTIIGSLGPGLYWPLLDFGALDAQIEIADLQTRAQLDEYKETILRAVEEVDDANASYRAQQQSLRSLNEALAAAREATKLATERYDRGLTDYLNVLDAERQEFALEQRQVIAVQTVADNLVALYKAVGGGWPAHEVIPPIRAPQPAAAALVRTLLTPGQVH
jgi:NodT family efflux transporter outer membrane factor (OMF) lipoprotein